MTQLEKYGKLLKTLKQEHKTLKLIKDEFKGKEAQAHIRGALTEVELLLKSIGEL